jgi:SAM-dependent methyltransferase
MSNQIPALLDALFGDVPYFGGQTEGYQGTIVRHMFMVCGLQLAIDQNRPVRMLEIGSWTGNSALTWAQGIRQFSPKGGSILCLDPWGQYFSEGDVAKGGLYHGMDTLAALDLAYNLFLHNTKSIKDNVTLEHIRGTSADLKASGGQFDLIYIDGSHYYDDVLLDLQRCAPLLREGGILCGDDLEAQVGRVEESFLLDKKRVNYTGGFHPGVALAVFHFFRRAISVTHGFWHVRKKGDSFEDTSMLGLLPIVPDHFTAEGKAECQKILGR